ncbi:ribosome biogenesis protein LTV1 NDAI_0C03760 [Naumovozyma dairenensis CBS 421]|uniref:Low temperature viability protein n=1 Tax=Naumovozyma dairenensis (strain ATCC 10597 / BCRC 20456 / CBS 421 / NBRC 0211 / NRRL Y-12639) TaxID=1071378 RepID=G0W8C5_NAUDC|nr:hypothetical protein NDAI_0C03760 [Naumovozyma dairenensis CBS 421]CCD24036.1 hypothetical protein NDAI_0C03760 [Naumovozyma dairenensis CBS 421]
MSKRFSKKNAQKYVVVHRPHDDPHFYDEDASAHVLVSVSNPNDGHKQQQQLQQQQGQYIPKLTTTKTKEDLKLENKNVGEAALYGINFDDSKYDYTQHLKPIGTDPNAVFVPAKSSTVDKNEKKKDIEDLFVEPEYKDTKNAPVTSVFQRGVAKPDYLLHQQEVTEDIAGFKPDMNPALREVLEALEDEAYVVNDDVEVVKSKKNKKVVEPEEELEEDDVFAQLLGSGEVKDDEEFEDGFDEWDMDEIDNYEDEHYRKEMSQFDNIENLEDLQDIDYQADVIRFQKEKSKYNEYDSDEGLANESVAPSDFQDEEEEEENDVLGDLPNITAKNAKKGGKKRKDRRKKGAMSDISGFSMSSSAIARTETMTVLDDQFDNVIGSYENYEDEIEEDEENYKPFDMKAERSDFESMLDDFLDNYELESGGRKLAKKDEEIDRLKKAADEVSKGKLSQRRNREREEQEAQKAKNTSLHKVTNSLSSLHF